MKRSPGIPSNNLFCPAWDRLLHYLAVLLCVMCFPPFIPAFARDTQITIAYTNSLNGNLDYCRCKSDPRGGLVKRATEIKKIRKAHKNVLLVETGDFFTFEPDILLNTYIIKAYKHIGYDAVSPGDQEFSGGAEEFLRYRSELPFICSNLMIRGRDVWEKACAGSRIIEMDGIRIGITAAIAPEAFKYYPAKVMKNIKTSNQHDEIRKEISALKKNGAAFIILLSHSGYEDDLELQKRISGADVIVGGHSQTLLKEPVKSGKSLLVQAGANGARIGILELTISNGGIKSFKNSFAFPDEFQPADDPHIRKLINDYQAQARKAYDTMRFK